MDTDAGDVVLVTESFRQETIAYFPGEDRRALAFVLRDAGDHLGCRYAWFTAANCAWTNGTRLVVSTEYLAHAAV